VAFDDVHVRMGLDQMEEAYLVCPNCDFFTNQKKRMNYCPNCGTKLSDKCPKCNQQISDPYSKFCTDCGHKTKTGIEVIFTSGRKRHTTLIED
jgi:predicted amidophosphoribosyltransferase